MTEIRLNQLLEMVPGVLADEEAFFRTKPYDRGPVRSEAGKAEIRPEKALEPD